jgi:hypothetical protein
MKNFFHKSFSVLALGLAASLSASVAVAQEPARQGVQDSALESLRAGAVSDTVLVSTEREVLVSASAPILETLRAEGIDFSDNEVQVILVTLAVVLLVVLLV